MRASLSIYRYIVYIIIIIIFVASRRNRRVYKYILYACTYTKTHVRTGNTIHYIILRVNNINVRTVYTHAPFRSVNGGFRAAVRDFVSRFYE